MRVSGVTIAYQAVENGYPVAESIRSMLPVCDEIVVNIGQSDDGTREAVAGIGSGKIRLIADPWDLDLRTKGHLLSRETNRAMDACTGDWILYLQADEVLHENDMDEVRRLMRVHLGKPRIDGISFRYVHFYGSPRYYQDHPFRWYPRAVRVVRRDPAIRSVGDALKFRRFAPGPFPGAPDSRPGRLRAVRSGVRVYHYGWARPPEIMLRKQKHFERFWFDDETIRKKYQALTAAAIYSDLGHLERFTGTHPAVMRGRVEAAIWEFDSHIDRQPPRWLRRAGVFLLYPVTRGCQKLFRRLRASRILGRS
jgi:glycosyltransferase involved in cell wall biosynthesis